MPTAMYDFYRNPNENRKGFPRPVHKKNGKNTPVPWVGGEYPYMNRWAEVAPERALQADLKNLCIVCGEPCGDDYVYALLNGKAFDRRSTIFTSQFSPSPTYGHPKCILLAALYCPHLKRQRWPAKDQKGNKLTLDDLKKLAREEKDGKQGKSQALDRSLGIR